MQHVISLSVGCCVGQMAAAQDFGLASILPFSTKEQLPELVLVVGKPIADGSGKLALEASGFLRASLVNEVARNGPEVRTLGLDSQKID
ncbi:MAG: hypothetical protein WBN04_15735 [Paracoccaceae bacterium]